MDAADIEEIPDDVLAILATGLYLARKRGDSDAIQQIIKSPRRWIFGLLEAIEVVSSHLESVQQTRDGD